VNVLTCSITASGAHLAARLPYEHRAGSLLATVRAEWASRDGFVIVGATGIAVRAIAPMLADKQTDPAVVCVDDAGHHVIALTGGHAGGANDLASDVAALLGATPVVSTASDLAGLPALDRLRGFTASGDVAGVTRFWLDGRPPRVLVDGTLRAWPLPPGGFFTQAETVSLSEHHSAVAISHRETEPGPAVVITDRDLEPGPATVALRPRSLVIGVGASRGADAALLASAVRAALERSGLHRGAVAAVATADIKADEGAIRELATGLAVPLLTFPAAVLAGQPVPNPSEVVNAAVGTPSVAEAAALLAAGVGADLVVAKTKTGDSTLAIARRARPAGHLSVVGLGPGHASRRTPEAAVAVRHADVVVGYGPYVDQADDLLRPGQEVVRSPIGAEVERCALALQMAVSGRQVALVCSGDPGVYALASLVCEMAPDAGDPEVTVVPGVTAALSGAAVLGAPLGHDHASISLSDLLTPWEDIRRRVEAVAAADFVVSLYNPKSNRRTGQLPEALAILAAHRPEGTPAAVLTDIGRPGQHVIRTTLERLDPGTVGMLSLVVVGSSNTRWIGDRMVTPRGYRR
jgi:cobalt-precorrin 5A hydrolase/precorrin-3B C17-methyltransferase